jgi:hypothetical protein
MAFVAIPDAAKVTRPKYIPGPGLIKERPMKYTGFARRFFVEAS